MLFRNNLALNHRTFVLLAPANESQTRCPGGLTFSRNLHSRLFSEMQSLRGRIYLADGALSASDLDPWGRHVQAADSESWHLLTLSSMGRVIGCTRMRR